MTALTAWLLGERRVSSFFAPMTSPFLPSSAHLHPLAKRKTNSPFSSAEGELLRLLLALALPLPPSPPPRLPHFESGERDSRRRLRVRPPPPLGGPRAAGAGVVSATVDILCDPAACKEAGRARLMLLGPRVGVL